MTADGKQASDTTSGENSVVEVVASYNCPRCNHPFGLTAGHPGRPLTTVPCPHCATPFFVPGRIGDFVLVEALASDTLATFYRATGLTLMHDVAIKIVPPAGTVTEEQRNRLNQDVRTAAQVTNPHLGKVLALSVADDHAFLVMELLKGETLAHRLQQTTRMAECDALRLVLDVADGLAALHANGLVHGSVNPDQIVLCEDGVTRLSCPGLLGSPRRDASGGLLGSPLCMAPEVIGGKPDTPLSDLYALGVTLYDLLTGHYPFAGKTADAIFKGHLFAVVLPVSVHTPTLSAATRELVERLLNRNPYARFADSRVLIGAIHLVLAALDPTHPVPPPLSRRPDTVLHASSPASLAMNHRRLHGLIYALVATVGGVVLCMFLACGPFAKTRAPANAEASPSVPAKPAPPTHTFALAHLFNRQAAAAVNACTQRVKPDWQTDMLGDAFQHGSTLWYGETLAISGDGAGIDGTRDCCRFLNTSVTSPYVFSLRVDQIATTHPQAKTGILIRSNDTPSAPCVFAGFAGNGDMLLQVRHTPGAELETIRTEPAPADGWHASYVKMECNGDRFIAFASNDGNTWKPFGECQVDIPHRSLIGIAVASVATNETAMVECADIRLLTPPPLAPSLVRATAGGRPAL